MRCGRYYVPLCVPCQHGLVHRAVESITHIQHWRHHMTANGLKIFSLNSFQAESMLLNEHRSITRT